MVALWGVNPDHSVEEMARSIIYIICWIAIVLKILDPSTPIKLIINRMEFSGHCSIAASGFEFTLQGGAPQVKFVGEPYEQ